MKAPLILIALAVFLALPAASADFSDPDWPCIQRKQPRLSSGAVWAGPPIDELRKAWQDDNEIAGLVPVLAVRRTSMDEAQALIDSFAADLGEDRNERLTLLFAGVFDRIDRERSEIVAGIARYAGKQTGLASQIDRRRDEIATLAAVENPSFDQQDKLEELEDQLAWDTRIYSERAQSLTYVCESPVLLEQRVFALSRMIAGHME